MGGGSVVESVEEAKAGDAPAMGEDVELEAFLLPKDMHSSFLDAVKLGQLGRACSCPDGA